MKDMTGVTDSIMHRSFGPQRTRASGLHRMMEEGRLPDDNELV